MCEFYISTNERLPYQEWGLNEVSEEVDERIRFSGVTEKEFEYFAKVLTQTFQSLKEYYDPDVIPGNSTTVIDDQRYQTKEHHNDRLEGCSNMPLNTQFKEAIKSNDDIRKTRRIVYHRERYFGTDMGNSDNGFLGSIKYNNQKCYNRIIQAREEGLIPGFFINHQYKSKLSLFREEIEKKIEQLEQRYNQAKMAESTIHTRARIAQMFG